MRVMGRETTAQKRDIELLAAVYRRALRRFMDRVGAVKEASWRGKDGDSFHRALAHLAVAEENGLQLIRASLDGRINLPLATNGADDDSVAEFVQESPTGLLAHIEEVVEEQLALLLLLPDDGLLETPAVVPEWRFPGTIGHLYDHLYVRLIHEYQEIRGTVQPQLAHWFEGWMPENSNDFYDRLFHILPLIYQPEALEIDQVSLCIDLKQPGGGRWSLMLDRSRARAKNDCEGEMTATIQAGPRDFFDFFRGEGHRVKISGKGVAARSLRALFPLS